MLKTSKSLNFPTTNGFHTKGNGVASDSPDYEETLEGHSGGGVVINSFFEKEIRPFIDVIDELRKHGLDKDVSLPSVVVLGDQSSGKSSILEAISGVQLPRGGEIVTRCPLEMQLKKEDCEWCAKISYRKMDGQNVEEDISDPDSIEKEIRKAQDLIAGTSKGVSDSLITLRVVSPHCPDLTLIDLPGIARTAVEGQSKNIGKQIRNLIQTYIEKENSIILCVISANLDIAVNESISIAAEVDPEGKRTLGVISKPDLVVEKTTKKQVCDLLKNNKVKLKNGYSMVRCRNQEELENNVTLEEALEKERDFFQMDPVYKHENPMLLGISNLAEKLTNQLVTLIQDTIPLLKEEVNRKYEEVNSMLKELPEGPPNKSAAKLCYLMKIMHNLNNDVHSLMQTGRLPLTQSTTTQDNLFSDWRDSFKEFETLIKINTQTQLNSETSPLCKTKIEESLKKARGRELPRFLNYDLFESLVRQHINSYIGDAKTCLSKKKKHLHKVILEHVDRHLKHMDAVRRDVLEILHKVVDNQAKKTMQMILLQFDEENLIFSQDFNYLEIVEQNEKLELKKQQNRNTTEQQIESPIEVPDDQKNAELMRKMIEYYLQVANRRIADAIPMSIRLILHHQFAEEFKNRLDNYVSLPNAFEKVTEQPTLHIERCELHASMERLQTALLKLSRF